MKRLLAFLVLSLTGHMVFAQTFYTPVWTGNGLDHMNIYITSVRVNGVSVIPGSEIGVFDGDVCVGAAVRPTVIQNYIEIRVSKDDPTTPEVDGYIQGNPISFRIWNLDAFEEHLNVVATYTVGNPVFNPGTTALVALNVTTAPVNNPPVAVVSASQVVNEGQTVTISGANSYDPDGDPISYEWAVDPTIEGLNLTQASISLTAPEVTTNTSYTFTLIVNDGELNSQPAFTSLFVKDVNKPPVITGQQTIATNEGTPIALNISMVEYYDPDPGQSHTLLIYPGNNYLLSGNTITPSPGFSGTLSVPVRVSDGIALSNTWNLSVTVNAVNNAPQFTSNPVLSVYQGTTYLYHISATDPDGDVMTIAGVNIPSWLTLDQGTVNGTATLVGIPQVSHVGQHGVTLSLTDGIIESPVLQTFNITVQAATVAPVLITSSLEKAYANTAYTSPLEFYDADSDSVIVSLQNAPAWLSLQGAINGFARLKLVNQHVSVNLIGTPTTSSVGTFAITVLFTDKTNNRSKILPLQVMLQNTPPTATDVEVATDEDEQVLVVLEGTDNETPYGLIFELLSQPEHGILDQISARIYIYTPNENYFGTDEFEFRVKESGTNPLFDDAMVTITINPVNDPPIITASERHFTTLEGASVIVPNIEYNDDIDGEYASELELGALFGPFNGSFNFENHIYTPNPNFYGSDLFFLIASEIEVDGLESEPLMLWFNVEMVNQPAIISVRDIYLNEDESTTFIPVVSDRESDIENIEYHIILTPSNGTLVVENLTFTYTPDEDWFGTDYIVFQAKDFHGDWTPDLEIFIHVAPVNDAPVATSNEIDAENSTTVIIDFSDWVSDIDNTLDELTIEFILTDESGIGMGMLPSTIIQGADNMTFTYTSMHESSQDYILYRVFDLQNTSTPAMITINNLQGTKTDSKTDLFVAKGDYLDITWGDTLEVLFTLVVGGENQEPPSIEITNADELNGDLINLELLEFTPGHPLVTYKATYIAPNKSFEDDKPSGNATGVLFDRVGFSGNRNKKGFKEVSNVDSIYIGNLDIKVPTFIHPISPVAMVEGESVQVNILYTDPDTQDEDIQWDIVVGIEDVNHSFTPIEAGNVSLEITPPGNFFGNMVVSVTATDDTTTTARDFIVQILGLNQPPSIRMVDSIFYMSNTQRIVSALITDRETPTNQLDISFEADPSNAVEQILFSQGDLTIYPTQGFTSNFYVDISVSDGENEATHQIKFKHKLTNAMPMLSPINTAATLEDSPISVSITPMDPDPEDWLEVTIGSSNQNLIPSDGITITPQSALPGVERTINFIPSPDRFGVSDITVYVSDGFKSIAQQFTLQVIAVNDPPSLVEIDDQEMYNDQEITLALSAIDIDSYIFSFTAESSNQDLELEVIDNLLTIRVLNGYFGTTEFTVTVADDSLATHSQTVELIVHDATSAPTLNGNSILVYPNPTNNTIFVRGIPGDYQETSVNIFNLYGQLVTTKNFNHHADDVIKLDINHLPQGVYIIQVKHGTQQFQSRIIKN